MSEEEITSLAREYAEEMHYGDDYFEAENNRLLTWLLRRYCLVEKEVVRTTYQQAMEQGKHAHVKCHVESRAKLRLLERLFPEIAKDVEE